MKNAKTLALIKRGVRIPNPESVEIGDDIIAERISGDNVVIHSGCKLFGRDTYIGAGARLGAEAPVTVQDCQIGPAVNLKGGYFKAAVFLEGANCGSGAHVREGTILEEQASIAHTVGLKQTILFPFVILGSLINFCDCFMAGGTSRKNHSEVGSSYIHFNFTPNQDKATASLIGDVPAGVMLDQKPIFLGGQGGIIGPCRLTYGVTVAAGTIVRKDELRQDRLVYGGGLKGGSIKFTPGKYSGAGRILQNNVIYMANLLALEQWYRQVRSLFVGRRFPEPLYKGLIVNIRHAIEERTTRLADYCRQRAEAQKESGIEKWWPEVAEMYQIRSAPAGDPEAKQGFFDALVGSEAGPDKTYLQTILSLDKTTRAAGTDWLQSIVDTCYHRSSRLIPDLEVKTV